MRLNRFPRFPVFIFLAFIWAGTSAAQAEQAGKIPRICFLGNSTAELEANLIGPFREGLRSFGYIEGKNIAIEYRHAEGKGIQPELAADLVRRKVDLIVVAGGDGGIRAAMNATKKIPIVMTGPGSDPVRAGFVESLARPGGNVTGLTNLSRELGGKRLELLKEVVAKLNRVAVLYEPSIPGTAREVKEDLAVAARVLGLTVQPWEVRDVAGSNVYSQR